MVGGLGVVGLGIGGYFALHAKSTYDGASADGNCTGNECNAAGRQERNDAFSQATIATVAMAIGGGALVGGAVLYWVAPKTQPVTVGVGPGARGGSVLVSVPW